MKRHEDLGYVLAGPDCSKCLVGLGAEFFHALIPDTFFKVVEFCGHGPPKMNTGCCCSQKRVPEQDDILPGPQQGMAMDSRSSY